MEHEGASMRILLVDDDKILSGILAKALQNHEFVVDVTWTGEGGLRFAKRQIYDAIVLDIMLPAIDGLTVLKRLEPSRTRRRCFCSQPAATLRIAFEACNLVPTTI